MALAAGSRLGPHEIQSAIGAGGMGEVYKARDTRLDRTVAIKVLPPHFAEDPDRRARFEREAKAIAGLNHPHICTLYDVGEQDGATYLVIEHLSGETLAKRLEKGPLPLEQALTVATEIADALAAAHRQGVIHRDLKPGNVMLTKSGAKLLDFGLAKLKAHGERPAAESLASVPTATRPLTSEGTIVGTLQYMAPEQVEGKAVDARTDLWALGAILYEMVTGRRAFEGASAASLIAAILEHQPPAPATLRPLTPPALEWIVRRCLEKDPDRRPNAAHDVAEELRWLHEAGGVQGVIPAPVRHRGGLPVAALAGVALAMAAAGAGIMWLLRPAPDGTSVVSSTIKLEQGYRLGEVTDSDQLRPWNTALAMTPDGGRIVYSAIINGSTGTDKSTLFVREVGQLHATPIKGTDGARGPFLSPDGQQVGFWAAGKLMKIPITGGIAEPLCEARSFGGASWSDDGTIAFAPTLTGGLFKISEKGGKPQPLTTVKAGEASHRLPCWLPGGRALLFTIMKQAHDLQPALAAVDIESGAHRVVQIDAADPRLTSTAHLLFTRRGVLMAVPFDVTRVQPVGEPVSVLSDVMQSLNSLSSFDWIGSAQFSVSDTGDLVYCPGGIEPDVRNSLVWVDQAGRATEVTEARGRYFTPRLSPDGRRIAYQTHQTETLWVLDIATGTSTPLTTEGEVLSACWHPGGQYVTFAWQGPGEPRNLYRIRADGSEKMQRLTTSPNMQYVGSWSPDGSALAFGESSPTGSHIQIYRPHDRSVTPYFDSTFNEGYPEFSPDGRWVLFTSNRSGSDQVYVRPFPGPGPMVPVSTIDRAWQPFWARSGRQIFFQRHYTELWTADVISTGPEFKVGRPRLLFKHPGLFRGYLSGRPMRAWDISLDDKLFLNTRNEDRGILPVTEMILVQNWFKELKAKVSVR